MKRKRKWMEKYAIKRLNYVKENKNKLMII